MKKKDHQALGKFLLNSDERNAVLYSKWRQKLFMLGCVSPDFIPFTYFRGLRESRAFLGHNARYSAGYIQKRLNRFQKNGLYHWWDMFRFGMLMHYLADSFTFPHAETYDGNMSNHRKYEVALHGQFSEYLKHCKSRKASKTESLSAFFRQKRLAYESGMHSYEDDCHYIVETCRAVFEKICPAQISCKKI